MTFKRLPLWLYALTVSLVLSADCLMETVRASAAGPDPGALSCLGIDLVLVWTFTALAGRLRLQEKTLREPAGRGSAR